MSDQTESDQVVSDQPIAKAFEPHRVPLWDDVEGSWYIVPVDGHGDQWVAAVSNGAACSIASLAFPDAKIDAGGFAKNKPCRGEQVIFQVPEVILPEEKDDIKHAPKDVREVKRRNGLNYERRTY